MKKIFLAMTMAAALFSACSNDTDEIVNNSNGKLHVFGYIQETKTRVSESGSDWTSGDLIGVSGGGYYNVAYSTSSTSGTFAAVGDGIELTAANAGADFTAYYPYAATAGDIAFNVADASQNVDFLWASATASDYSVGFAFAHKMAKITLNLDEKTGNSTIESGDGLSVSLSGIPTTGTFNTTTGVVTAGTTDGSVSKSHTWTATNSVSFIVPSYASAPSKTINVNIAVGGKNYSGAITPALEAGNNYTYTVTINTNVPGETTTGLTISSATLTSWNDIIGEDVGADEVTVPNTLEVGDFLLADGTVVDKDDDLTGLSVAGVVYYVGNPGDATLTSDMTTVNGLAIALNNSGEAARLASAKYNYATWFSTGDNGNGFVGTNLNITSASSNMLGYNNTAILKAANTDASNCCDDLISRLNATTAVTGASAWYLPSYAELKTIQDNYSVINASIVKAGGSLTQYPDYTYSKAEGKAADASYTSNTNENFYWSSDLRGDSYSWVCPMAELTSTFTDEQFFVGRNSNGTKGYFRFAIAF